MTLKQQLQQTLRKAAYQSGKEKFHQLLDTYLVENGFKAITGGVNWNMEVQEKGLKIFVQVFLARKDTNNKIHNKYESTEINFYVAVNGYHDKTNNRSFDLEENPINVLSEIKEYLESLPNDPELLNRCQRV